MEIDLNEPLTRVVVQEYVNAILGFQSHQELDFDVHKLIHTFEVVKIAKELLDLASPALSLEEKKQVVNAALLHDIGRCHEFENGRPRHGYDHGAFGAQLIKKYCPDLDVEATCTLWHNRCPSERDPSKAQPILDFVRDADILGNIRYQIENMEVFLDHLLKYKAAEDDALVLDEEIQGAALERRSCDYKKLKNFTLLGGMTTQLLWIYNLRTSAAFRLSKQQNLFPRYRDAVINELIPSVADTPKQEEAAKLIKRLFPDSLFQEVIKRHES